MNILLGVTLSVLLICLALKVSDSFSKQNNTVTQLQQSLPQPTGAYAIQLHEALEAVLATMPLGRFYVDAIPLDIGIGISYGIETYTFALLYFGEKIVHKRLSVFKRALNQAVSRYCRLKLGELSLAFPSYTALDWQSFYPLIYFGFSAVSVYARDGYIYLEIVVLDNTTAQRVALKRI